MPVLGPSGPFPCSKKDLSSYVLNSVVCGVPAAIYRKRQGRFSQNIWPLRRFGTQTLDREIVPTSRREQGKLLYLAGQHATTDIC
jgi:hypothetical protein